MVEQSGTILLSLLILIILGSLHGGAAYECSSGASSLTSLSSCPPRCCDPYRYYGMFNTSVNDSCYNCPFSGCPVTFDGYIASIYVLVDLAPLMIYFPLLILFNINLAAGPAQSFVFFYQALPAAIPIDTYTIASPLGLPTMQSGINDLVFPRILLYIVLQYCKLVFAVVLVIMTPVLVRCVGCPCVSWRRPWAKLRRSVRHFRERRAQRGTVLSGVCSIAILTYGFVLQQSFTILQPARHCIGGAKYCSYYCTELIFCSDNDCSLVFIPVAALLLVGLFLSLPILLLYYPCVPALMQRVTKKSSPLITCHKLAPVFDVFQSAYKPKLRFFAALPLLYRFVIWSLVSVLSAAPLSKMSRQLTISFVFIIIVAIHSVFQPYSTPRHNYIETLYLVNLVLISMISIVALGIGNFVTDILLFLGTALAILPLVILLFGLVCYLWRSRRCKQCRAACCQTSCFKYIRQSRKETAQGETESDDELQVSEVYLDMGEVEINQAQD